MRMYNRRYEKLVREEIEQVQLERLQSTIQRAYKNVPFYQNQMKTRNVVPADITSVSDISGFGFTTRDDLGYNYPYGLFAVPLRDIVRINSTSGIGGKPTVVGYTKNDLGVWMDLLSRLYYASGITADDIVQFSFVSGLANWGRGMAAAAENIEASVVPMNFLNPEKEIMIMTDYKTSCLVSTPSHALHLAGVLSEVGVEPEKLSLKSAILVSEPMPDRARERIAETLGVRVSSGYGIPEVMGPGIAYECAEGRLHIAEDHFIAEIVDPKTGKVVGEGETGELVITTITTKAYPLIRFRTGDITQFIRNRQCPCGRTLLAIEPPTDRADDALSIRGVRIYPSQIERIITSALGEAVPYVIEVHKVRELDELDILVEEVESLFSDEIKVLERMIAKIKDDLWEILGIRANVRLVEHVTMKEVKGENSVIMSNHKMKE